MPHRISEVIDSNLYHVRFVWSVYCNNGVVCHVCVSEWDEVGLLVDWMKRVCWLIGWSGYVG